VSFAISLTAAPADWIWCARYAITEDGQRVIENAAVAIVGDHTFDVGYL
jgi:hypothetical protein